MPRRLRVGVGTALGASLEGLMLGVASFLPPRAVWCPRLDGGGEAAVPPEREMGSDRSACARCFSLLVSRAFRVSRCCGQISAGCCCAGCCFFGLLACFASFSLSNALRAALPSKHFRHDCCTFCAAASWAAAAASAASSASMALVSATICCVNRLAMAPRARACAKTTARK